MTEFNVGAWIKEGESALAELKRREHVAKTTVSEAQRDLSDIQDEIKKISSIVGGTASTGDGGDGVSDRRSGVLDLVRDVVSELKPDRDMLGWPESFIVEAVLESDPMMKDKSIRGSLRRMSKDGTELERSGKRGSYRYRMVKKSDHATIASADDRIYSAMVSAGRAGGSLQDLVWILGDESATLIVLDAMITAGAIETFPVGEGKFNYRLLEDEATEVHPKALFGAEPPTAGP